METKVGYCPICDMPREVVTDSSMSECPRCGHAIVLHTKSDQHPGCRHCREPYDPCAKYYIKTGYSNDPYVHILWRTDITGGVMIEYCPWCGRKLVP